MTHDDFFKILYSSNQPKKQQLLLLNKMGAEVFTENLFLVLYESYLSKLSCEEKILVMNDKESFKDFKISVLNTIATATNLMEDRVTELVCEFREKVNKANYYRELKQEELK